MYNCECILKKYMYMYIIKKNDKEERNVGIYHYHCVNNKLKSLPDNWYNIRIKGNLYIKENFNAFNIYKVK